jgi:hypothetical protein
MAPGVTYRLHSAFTAIDHSEDLPCACRLPAGTILTGAATIPLSQFVQVTTTDGRVYDVLRDDLAESGSRQH